MDKLGFHEKVLQAFKFLSDVYGYKCVVSEPEFIRFESELLYVKVYFDRSRSVEVGVELGERLQGAPSERIGHNLGEILRYFGAPEPAKYSLIQISTPERMSELIPMIAGLLRK